MRFVFFAFFSFFLATHAYCKEPSTSIEDKNLRVVPTDVDSAVVNDKSFATFKQLNCKTRDVEVVLSISDLNKTWFVTTADGCGWGAALAPIWIIAQTNSQRISLLLSTGGYALIPSNIFHNGMADIVISAGTSGESESKAYIFDGKLYVPKSRK
ncbi:hypothetical protein EO087_12030 [Dyella sp. M7H15-1]|uniref:hypothetical protein n=1 Tax=Dyella sp. M7H15-1 TaxID=2501295 RepID=UPI001004ED05|nr:hypothetical protein [Dyella sp. M7H15-1]QAU24629.1 hypothetical protein EO087_12030 [Dyella sp. M7H15-1]